MKKKIIALSLSVLLLAGCAKTTPELKDGEQIITSLKGDRNISVKDLYEELKDRYGLEALISMIDKIILEDKYQNDLESAKSDAENTMAQLKAQYKDDLLSTIQYYTNYNTIEDYQDYLYISYLQQKAVTDYAKEQITESQIKKYYKDEVKSDIKVSHIFINVNASSTDSNEDKTNAENDAKAKATEIINKLNESNNVTETFAELAKEYSSDETTKNDGGNLGYINTDTLGESYKELVDAAYKLKDGQYSKEVVKTELGYHVILRTETKEKVSLEDAKDSIKEKLSTQYIADNSETSIKAMQQLRKEYEMDINDDELQSYYTNYIQNSLAQLREQASSTSNK